MEDSRDGFLEEVTLSSLWGSRWQCLGLGVHVTAWGQFGGQQDFPSPRLFAHLEHLSPGALGREGGLLHCVFEALVSGRPGS